MYSAFAVVFHALIPVADALNIIMPTLYEQGYHIIEYKNRKGYN